VKRFVIGLLSGVPVGVGIAIVVAVVANPPDWAISSIAGGVAAVVGISFANRLHAR
jgi:hypothetical protein